MLEHKVTEHNVIVFQEPGHMRPNDKTCWVATCTCGWSIERARGILESSAEELVRRDGERHVADSAAVVEAVAAALKASSGTASA